MIHRTDRGSWLAPRAAGLLVAATILAFVGIASVAAQDAGSHTHGAAHGQAHDAGQAPPVTAAELAAAARLVGDVQSGTRRFADVAVARAEGYREIMLDSRGLAHYHNQAYFLDGRVLDPERPEQLIYLERPTGETQLVGVMFLMRPGEPGPRVGGALTPWHTHDGLCISLTSGTIVALVGAAGECPPGSAKLGRTPEMLHVWLVDNPAGVFADDLEPAALLDLSPAR
jgi:hypothetical protein